MFERISKYQYSVFGDFQEIALDPKVITELIELFKDFKDILVPSAPTSSFKLIEGKSNPSFRKLVSLNFTNQDKTLVIQFNGTAGTLATVQAWRRTDDWAINSSHQSGIYFSSKGLESVLARKKDFLLDKKK